MKKIIFFLFISILVISCNKEKPKYLSCTEYSVICEKQKDYQLVKVLAIPYSNMVDCYGLPLIKGNWYFYYGNNNNLIPAPDDLYAHYENADRKNGISTLKNIDQVKSDTTSIDINSQHFLKSYPKVKMLLFGSRYIQLEHGLGGGVTFCLKEGSRQ